MRRLLRVMLLTATLGICSGLGIGLGACTGGDSVEDGCQTREDCPRPDRQTCEVATGVCVGFTSPPGAVDGGDDEGIDAGADAG